MKKMLLSLCSVVGLIVGSAQAQSLVGGSTSESELNAPGPSAAPNFAGCHTWGNNVKGIWDTAFSDWYTYSHNVFLSVYNPDSCAVTYTVTMVYNQSCGFSNGNCGYLSKCAPINGGYPCQVTGTIPAGRTERIELNTGLFGNTDFRTTVEIASSTSGCGTGGVAPPVVEADATWDLEPGNAMNTHWVLQRRVCR